MTIHVHRDPRLPYQNQPGLCPACGVEVRPRNNDVYRMGVWDGRDEKGARIGGLLVGINCPECGTVLITYNQTGGWPGTDPSKVIWYRSNKRSLVGGDRWRGRPGAWDPDDVPRIDLRFAELIARLDSLDEAIRTLHFSAGLGALQLIGVVQRVAALPIAEAKQRVVHALLESWDNEK